MNCFECNKTVEIKQYKAHLYDGIGLDHIYLLNAEVLFCSTCKEESIALKQPSKIHAAIGIAIALQPARLSGKDIRFLRRSAGFSLREWAARINVAEATYSKWENAHRSITPQADKLARLNFLSAIGQKYPETFHIEKYIETVLNLQIERQKDFAIAVDAENPETEARYLPFNSPLLARPEMSIVEAKTLRVELVTTATIISGRLSNMSASIGKQSLIGEMQNVSETLSLAA